MMIRSAFSSVLWLIPAIFLAAISLAACASSTNPAEEVSRPSGALSEPGTTAEALPEPPATEASKDSPTPAGQPSPEALQATASLEATVPPQVMLPDLGPAPDIMNEVWLNTDQPLNLAALRGRVVLVEFWTFG